MSDRGRGGDAGADAAVRPEVDTRVAAVRDILARRPSAAALLSTRRNFAWLTAGGESHILLSTETGVASLLVTADEVVAVTQNIEAARIAEEELEGLGIETVAVPWWEPDAIAAEARRRTGGTPVDDAGLEADLVPVRSVLSALDRKRLVELGDAARGAVEAALAVVSEGMTEHDLAALLLGRLGGLRAPVVLVAADDRIPRYRHPIPTDTPIRSRVMLVLVAERWGLHVALTRFRELDSPSADLRARFSAVEDVEHALAEATVSGATLGDVLAAAQAAYAAAGFRDAWRDHHQGGTIGYQARETIGTPGNGARIEAGMAFAWNPSVPGAKLEDTFILAEDGSRTYVTRRAVG